MAKLLRNFQYSSRKGSETSSSFFHFQYRNFEDTVTYFDKDMFRKRLLPVQTLTVR